MNVGDSVRLLSEAEVLDVSESGSRLDGVTFNDEVFTARLFAECFLFDLGIST